MIRTILYFKAKPGLARDVANFFKQREIPARSLAMPGCLHVELGIAAPDGDEVVATALWASREAYEGWLASGGRANDVADLSLMLVDGPDAIGSAAIFEVLLSASPSTNQ